MDADLRGADLTDADLEEANLRRANIQDTIIDPELAQTLAAAINSRG